MAKNIHCSYNPEKESCLKVFLMSLWISKNDDDDESNNDEENENEENEEEGMVLNGDAMKQGVIKISRKAKVTGFGVKDPEMLNNGLMNVTRVLWSYFDEIATRGTPEEKTKPATTRSRPICSVCGETGHNKRTCKKKQ
jgi:hypothetical protein